MAIYDCQPSCGIPKGCIDAMGMTFPDMEGQEPDAETFCTMTSSDYFEGVCFLDDPKFKPALKLSNLVFYADVPALPLPVSDSAFSLALYNDDQQILMAGMPWWVVAIEGALALIGKLLPKWIPIEGLAKHFHNIPVINRFVVAKEHKLVFAELADTKDFYEGVLKCQEMGYGQNEALKITFRYMLLSKERMQSLGIPGESYFTLKAVKDVAIAGFKPLQIQHTAELVSSELKLPLPFGMIEPMANLNREIPPQAIDKKLTDTQEIVKKQGAAQQNQEWESVKDILSMLLKKIEPMPDAPDGELSVCVGPYSVKIGKAGSGEGSGLISLPVVSLSKEGLVSTLSSVVDKLNRGIPLTDSEKLLVEQVRKNPIVEQVVDVFTRPYEDAVSGTSRWLDLLKEAKKPENTVLRRALWEVSQMPQGPVGLVLNGGVSLQIDWKAPLFDHGTEVMLAAPYYIGPYSFTKGLQILVGEEAVEKLPAVIGWDENGKALIIDINSMNHFDDVLEWMRTQRGMHESDLWNAYASFYNDMLVVWKAIYNDFALPKGAPRSVIERYKLFKKINDGVRLRQKIDQAIGDIGEGSQFTEGTKAQPAAELKAAIGPQLELIKGEFVEFFDADRLPVFETTLKLLEEAALKGGPAEVTVARDAVVAVIDGQLQSSSKKLAKASSEGFSKVGPRSFGFLDEVKSWMQTSTEQLKRGTFSQDIGEAIVARNMTGILPNLAHAEEYASQGSYTKAFTVYDLVIWDPETKEADRVEALAGMVDLAVQRYDFFRIALGLQELQKMVKRGTALTPKASKLVTRLVSYETPLFPVEVPKVLKDLVMPEVATAKNTGVVITNGGGAEKFNWKKVLERTQILPQPVVEKVEAAIAEARSGELFGYKTDFLKIVALSNTSELEGLFKGLYPQGEYLVRLNEVKPFHKKTAAILDAALGGGSLTIDPLSVQMTSPNAKGSGGAVAFDMVGDLLGGGSSSKTGLTVDVSAMVLKGGGTVAGMVKGDLVQPDIMTLDVAKRSSGIRKALKAIKAVAKFGRRVEKK